jgi:hypothetical protein
MDGSLDTTDLRVRQAHSMPDGPLAQAAGEPRLPDLTTLVTMA